MFPFNFFVVVLRNPEIRFVLCPVCSRVMPVCRPWLADVRCSVCLLDFPAQSLRVHRMQLPLPFYLRILERVIPDVSLDRGFYLHVKTGLAGGGVSVVPNVDIACRENKQQ